jgi:hypothetical protein
MLLELLQRDSEAGKQGYVADEKPSCLCVVSFCADRCCACALTLRQTAASQRINLIGRIYRNGREGPQNNREKRKEIEIQKSRE